MKTGFYRARDKVVLGVAGVIAAIALAATIWSVHPVVRRWSRGRVDFSRDIRPIFNQNCVACHGGVRQKNGVSFIFREEALGKGKSGRPTIVPGDPQSSELMARVTSKDPDAGMPYHAAPLPQDQIALLRRWISEGAQWSDYWAFVPPKPQSLPAVKRLEWVRQPIDRFILARLERESLSPSAEANKSELLRRVSLDLTGLPPTVAEQADFLTDNSNNAYEKQVDRLLSSPAYGERWASMWLDLARYADSMGYEADRRRPGVWAYRDWVIDAYNQNLSYDQFVIKQLAGDLLPNATFEDRIATAFHRQTPNNQEGGTDDEEFRLVAVMDRVATTWSVLNGITMNCVQCHSHPYDPIRHAEYYKSLAFFNTSDDADRDDDFPNLKVPKDKTKCTDAAGIQQEIGPLVRRLVAADRKLVESGSWTNAPIVSAAADEAPALLDALPGAERYLEDLKKDKDPPALKKEDIANQLEAIRVIKSRLTAARARGGPARTFHLRDDEAFADATTPAKSVYELKASALPSITAIRVEVSPIDADKARHTPEDGFIVDRVQAFVVHADGKKERIVFGRFLHDSTENLETSVTPEKDDEYKAARKAPKEVEDGFTAIPKLFRTRWIVGVLAEPLHAAASDQIEVTLKQTREIDYKPVQIQRARLSFSSDPGFTSRIQDAERVKDIGRLSDLEARLARIPSVNVPVMSEEEPYEKRATREFERGNFLNKIGPDLAAD